MATKTLDKNIILNLTVNMAPLAIILFFVVAFTSANPSGFESLTSGLQYTLLIAPFVLLVALTHLSGKTIAGSEKEGTTCTLGRVMVLDAKPLYEEESEGAAGLEESSADNVVEAVDETV